MKLKSGPGYEFAVDVSVDTDGALLIHGEYRDKQIQDVMLALHCSCELAKVYLARVNWDAEAAIREGRKP